MLWQPEKNRNGINSIIKIEGKYSNTTEDKRRKVGQAAIVLVFCCVFHYIFKIPRLCCMEIVIGVKESYL